VPDLTGRPVVAVSFTGEKLNSFAGRNREEVLLDPETYAFRGYRTIALEDWQAPAGEGDDHIKEGQISFEQDLAAWSIVDQPKEGS
jgi:hypothetical protein